MKPSDLRQRVVDVAEELFKFTLLTRQHAIFLVDRYSEREEVRKKGRLSSQAEKLASDAATTVTTAATATAVVTTNSIVTNTTTTTATTAAVDENNDKSKKAKCDCGPGGCN